MQAASDAETGLGGKLFYAAELDAEARALVVAANIAGAATLVVTDDRTAQKQALRDGVVDFIVNSLDEALRILKNQLRTGGTVSVCVTLPPPSVEAEMKERGVRPDLLPPSAAPPDGLRFSAFLALGAQRIDLLPLPPGVELRSWPISGAWLQRTAQFDVLLRDCLPPADLAGRRWLRLAPRYLGPQARHTRYLACDAVTAARIDAAIS